MMSSHSGDDGRVMMVFSFFFRVSKITMILLLLVYGIINLYVL